MSAGTSALLRHGATSVLSAGDVLEAIGVVVECPRRAAPEGDAARVLAVLRDAPASGDEIARATGIPAGNVAALLTGLELDGLVEIGDGAFRSTVTA